MEESMKKVAIFVEGQTEQLFMEKVIKEIMGMHGFSIKNYKFIGGKNYIRKALLLTTFKNNENIDFFFIIYDCGGDESVKSDICERIESLKYASFTHVIGLRDVFPETDINKIKHYLYYGLPAIKDISTNIILAINEIEAWFLAEETHYPKISKKLNIQIVNETASIDVSKDDTQVIICPSDTLKQIYIKGGTTYDKSKEKVERTVNYLDYDNLYFSVRKRNNSLNELLTCLDGLIP